MRLLSSIALGLLALLAGCDADNNRVANDNSRTGTPAAAPANNRGTAPITTNDTRDDFVRGAEQRLQAIEQRLDRLRADAANARDQAAEDMRVRLQGLDKQRAAARAELQRLRDAAGEAWRDVRAGVTRAMDELDAATRDMTAPPPPGGAPPATQPAGRPVGS